MKLMLKRNALIESSGLLIVNGMLRLIVGTRLQALLDKGMNENKVHLEYFINHSGNERAFK